MELSGTRRSTGLWEHCKADEILCRRPRGAGLRGLLLALVIAAPNAALAQAEPEAAPPDATPATELSDSLFRASDGGPSPLPDAAAVCAFLRTAPIVDAKPICGHAADTIPALGARPQSPAGAVRGSRAP